MNLTRLILLLIGLLPACVTTPAPAPPFTPTPPEQLIQPLNFEYKGAFKVPIESTPSSWAWGMNDSTVQSLTYYPGGDKSGPNDAYPGSLFGGGHVYQKAISEISIPVPVISKDHKPAALNRATTLQPFADITGGLMTKIPVDGQGSVTVHYLPGTPEKLMWVGYQAYNVSGCDVTPYTFGWSDLTLSSPNAAGLWKMKTGTPGSTAKSMMTVPEWFTESDPAIKGMTLGVWRSRPGGLCTSFGPSLYLTNPRSAGPNPPNKTEFKDVYALGYSSTEEAYQYAPSHGSQSYPGYQAGDNWGGGAFLEAGNRRALVFVGTKALGIKAAIPDITDPHQQTYYGLQRQVYAVTEKTGDVSGTATGEKSGQQSAVVWVTATHVVLSPSGEGGKLNYANQEMVTTTGGGRFRINTPAVYVDAGTAHGYYSGPYQPQAILYDPAAIRAFIHHNSRRVVPYAVIDLTDMWQPCGPCLIGGTAWDPAHGLLYILQSSIYWEGSDPYPIIHVYKINP